MKLESSPKLDSKTSQKSNSKSKSPKIQRAKTCDSKKLTKSKNSSKLKSFIRTIPISIALASALSSQAVAGWSVIGGGNVSNVNNVGTITSNITLGDTIIEATANGSYTDIVIGSNVTLTRNDFTASDNNIIRVVEADGGKVTNLGTLRTYSRKRVLHMQGRHMEAFINQGTINNQYWTFYMKSGSSLGSLINEGGTIINSNTGSDGVMIRLENASSIGQITIDGGSIQSGRSFISLANASTIDNITISGNANVENTSSGRTSIDLSGGSVTGTISVEDTASLKSNINISGNNRIGGGIIIGGGSDSPTFSGNITLNNGSILGQGIQVKSGTMTSEVSLNGSSRISKILIDGSNMGGSANGTPKLAGNITMDGTSAIANGITITNGGTYAGTIHNRNSSSIGGVVVDNGTIVGDIIASGTSRLNGITIVNGGEMRGNIEASWVSGSNGHTMNLGNIDIQSRLQGGITLANAATIESLSLSNGGTITNAVSIGAGGSNGHTSILKTITLNGASGINSLVVGSSSDNAGTINSITLGGNSSIGSINVAQRGTIANLDIGNASQVGSIGSITNAGKLQNITLNNTSTITNGITNNSGGTISNIALNGASTITNGITNNSGGTISNITLASSNTIHNGIKNDGVITEINHNVAGVENAVTNNAGGSISKLIISQGTIEYNGEGAITEELSVKGGATLSMNSGSGTITMNGAVGSKLNLESGSTFKGSLKNTGSISSWSNVSNIEGSFINDAGANIGSLSAGQIAENLLNKGNIGDLTIDNVVGTLSNESEITTLSVQNRVANGILNSGNIQTLTLANSADLGSVGVSNVGVITNLNNHKAGMQITNAQGIGTLAVDANTTYAGNGSITNALDIDGVQTQFTIDNNGTLTLAENANTANSVKTITNEGTIIGNLINTLSTNWIGGTLEGNFTNKSGATLESLFNGNAGTITGKLINAGSIVSLDSGTIGGSLDNQAGGIINTLHSSVVENLSNAGVVKDFIVDSDMDYTGNGSITNSMTILNNNTLNIGNAPSNGTININFGASATGTIGNAGTINGNITNLTTSTIKNFVNESTGKIDGDIINKGIITSFTNSGSFEGNLTNNKTIENLTTGAITGNITNAGSITTLIASGNVTNGITNNADIGSLIVNESVSYSGTGSISNALEVAQGDTLTIGSGSDTLKFNATNGTITNAGIINGTINNIKGSSILDFDNSGSITVIINNGHIAEFTNSASGIIDNFVNDYTISFFENNGVIKDFSGKGIIYGVLNSKEIAGDFENVATSLKNTGTITGNVQLIGNQQNCGNEICKTSDLINTGTIGDVASSTGGTIINQKDDVLNLISNGEENGVDSAIIVGGVENSGEIKDIINYNNGTIQGIIDNKDADSIIGKIQNTGVMGGISNAGNITTINTGSITGSIANSGEITTLNVTGNVDNGITNDSNITNLTINQGVSLGNNGITNNAAIGNFTNNANITYSGNGSITGNFSNTKDSIITLNDDLILNGNGNAFRNDGILKGTISNIGALSSFTNTGSITGLESGNITGLLSNSNTGIIDNLVVNGNVSQMQNAGNITDAIIKSEITNGIINGDSNHKQATIGKLDIQASLGSNGLQNAGTITSLINNFSNTKLNNAGNIGSLDIQKNLNYSGSGSITNSIKIASNTTLTTSGITLNANNGSVNNEGILAGNLTLKGSSNTLSNAGTINGNLTNSANTSTIANSGSINGTIINNATNGTIINADNSNIAALDINESVIYNQGTNANITSNIDIAKDKTLTIQNSGSSNGTLSFDSKNGNVNNLGTIAGNLSNVKDSIITSFKNSGTITGNLYNDGHIDTLSNTGTMGTIYNTSKETIVALGNGKGATIEAVNNTGNINIITNDGTINGQITSQNNSEIKEILIGENGIVNAKGTLDSSNMQDKSNDAVSLDTINTTLIHNQGTIQGNVRVVGQGSVIGEITNQDTISGCILVDGGRIGNINNANGAIANCMQFSSGASV
ncbi:beta strand repeat-containing protein, partial [Helicobacter pullorum]|uniref:beta strand repeat-containing protein n=1 Tax=Helicobacter pullorum TaxID=35818 RepID=UPI00242E2D0C